MSIFSILLIVGLFAFIAVEIVNIVLSIKRKRAADKNRKSNKEVQNN